MDCGMNVALTYKCQSEIKPFRLSNTFVRAQSQYIYSWHISPQILGFYTGPSEPSPSTLVGVPIESRFRRCNRQEGSHSGFARGELQIAL